jgi:GLPGLI family protein
MLKAFFYVLAVFSPAFAWSQRTVAAYKITQNYIIPNESGINETVTVALSGYLYRKNNRYIYFEKPDYLSQLENGSLIYSRTEGNVHTLVLPTDSLQDIYYSDYDSLIQRYRSQTFGMNKNIFQAFDPDFLTWELLPESKTIHGLSCQKATLTRYGQLQWVVWFAAGIPMRSGMSFIKGLPGLIVDADLIPLNKHYSLMSVDSPAVIPESLFWPAAFNQPFSRAVNLKKNNESPKEVRQVKKMELLKQ